MESTNIAHSIFEPRFKKVLDKKTGEVVLEPLEFVNDTVYDEYYYDYELVEVPVPVPGSEDEYTLVPKIKESKRSIREVIDSQADDVGLDNIMRKFALTGDQSVLPSPVQATDEILDLTRLPQDGAEYFTYIHALAAQYEALPIELRQDMTMDEFIKNVTQDQVNSYLNKFKPKGEVKAEKEGDK